MADAKTCSPALTVLTATTEISEMTGGNRRISLHVVPRKHTKKFKYYQRYQWVVI